MEPPITQPSNSQSVDRKVLLLLRRKGAQTIDGLTMLTGIGWGQVFLSVDRLSRTGKVSLTPVYPSVYRVSVAGPVPASLRPLHILLAEDLEDSRAIVTVLLQGTPYELDMAEIGAVAAEKFRTGTYDLVFMDIQMPVMNGYQATDAIRQWECVQQRVPTPIVALTALTFKDELDKTLATGCTAYLTKPINKRTLLNTIVEHTRRPSAPGA